MAAKPRILIIGAGIGGLTAALALLRRGYAVEAFNQVPALSELGAGIQVAANGSRVLRELGLGDELDRRRMQDLSSASERYGSPHYTMHRADLQEMLRSAVLRADPHAVKLGMHCVGFEASTKSVIAAFENGERAQADVLIGAAGIHSIVRQTLFGADKAEFTGAACARGKSCRRH
jgi:salicylate hydroxylase